MSSPKPGGRPERAGLLSVAKVIFFGLLMIGSKATWEKGGAGAQLTRGQVVVGAIIGGLVVVGLLVLLARMAVRFATGQ